MVEVVDRIDVWVGSNHRLEGLQASLWSEGNGAKVQKQAEKIFCYGTKLN
jgi:hypothetical protein